jgi:hypothetical protein
LYSDRSSEDKQLFIRSFLRETKNTNMAGGWMLKQTYCLMETTHEPLQLDKRNVVQWKIMRIPKSFIWINLFFNRPFKYGDGGILKVAYCCECSISVSESETTKYCIPTDMEGG